MAGNRMSPQTRASRLAATALVALLIACPLAHADFAQAADKIRDAVVTVTLEKRMGAGCIVNGEGYILTNKHVVAEAKTATVKLANGDELPAQLVQADSARDLLLLKVDRQHLPTVTFASSAKLKQGTEVAALGAPFGLSDTLTKGIVSSTSRDLDGQKYVQIDAALNQGNSGGPIINEQGQVVGVATLVAKKAENMGFAIPSDDVTSFLNKAKVTYASLDAPPAAAATPPVPEGVPGSPAMPGVPGVAPPAPRVASAGPAHGAVDVARRRRAGRVPGLADHLTGGGQGGGSRGRSSGDGVRAAVVSRAGLGRDPAAGRAGPRAPSPPRSAGGRGPE